jgi:hypothetical protein
MINKGVIVTLGVVFLLSSVPFTTAQSGSQFCVGFGFDSGTRDYQVITSAIRVDGSVMTGGIIDNPIWNFVDSAAGVNIEGVEYFWYDFAWSAFFEANDTNKDGTFTPGVDQHVGAIVPLTRRWDSWNYSDFLLEKEGEVGYLQVSHDPDLTGMEGLTALHVNHTASMTITHQHDFLVGNIDDWPGVPGHTRPMDIEIEIGVHFNLTPQDQFKLEFKVSGWDWTYNDSILVFILSPHVRVFQPFNPEWDSVRNFTAVKHVGSRFYFGEGFMEYAQSASAGNATHQVEVNASHGDVREDDLDPYHAHYIPSIFTAFENFGDETLVYDINLGIDSVELPTIPRTLNTPDIPYGELLLTASIISIVTIVIIFYRNSKNARNDIALKPSI